MFDNHLHPSGLTWHPAYSPLDTAIQPEAIAKLAHFHQYPALRKDWHRWCHRELYRAARGNTRWRPETELAFLPPLSLEELPDVFKMELFYPHLGVQAHTLSLQAAQNKGFQTVTQFCNWLDGDWLTHYVFTQLQRVARTMPIQEARFAFRLHSPHHSYRLWEKFGINLMFLYQDHLFALACTPSDRLPFCQQHLQTASEQLQHIQSATALNPHLGLICCSPNPDILQSTVDRAIAASFLLCGQPDLRSVGAKIAHWIKNSTSARTHILHQTPEG